MYASGSISVGSTGSITHLGGLLGSLAVGSVLTNGYSIGSITLTQGTSTTRGGLIGIGGGTVSGRSFWDSTTSG